MLASLTLFRAALGTTSSQPKSHSSTTSFVEPQLCELVETRGLGPLFGGRLSPFWAQQRTGADLAKELTASSPNMVDVSVLDDACMPQYNKVAPNFFFDGKPSRSPTEAGAHCSNVGNIINGDDGVGFSNRARLVSMTDISQAKGGYKGAIDRIIAKGLHPKLVNSSMKWAGTESWESAENSRIAFQKLAERGTILVTAAGNGYPENVEEVKEKFPNLVIVSSCDPVGMPSFFNSTSNKVTLCAPSDEWLMSKEAKYRKFGGTSGASPEVTGALAGVVALIPDLTSAEAIELLKKTALPTPNRFETPQRDGVGMLNAYKLTAVAKRLVQACSGEGPECRKRYIHGEPVPTNGAMRGLFDFSLTPQARAEYTDLVGRAFPDCAKADVEVKVEAPAAKPDLLKELIARLQKRESPENIYTEDDDLAPIRPRSSLACSAERQKALKALRKRVLLDASDSYSVRALACVYKAMGYPADALFYEGLLVKNRSELDTFIKKAFDGVYDIHAMRTKARAHLLFDRSEGIRRLKPWTRYFDASVRADAIESLGYYGDSALPLIRRVYEENLEGPGRFDDRVARKYAMRAAARIGSPAAIEFLSEMGLADQDIKVRANAKAFLKELGALPPPSPALVSMTPVPMPESLAPRKNTK